MNKGYKYVLCFLLFIISLSAQSAQILDIQVTWDPKQDPLNIGDIIHFAVTTDGPGSVTVDISTVHQSIQLYDNGTNGDSIPGDNIYELDYVISEGDDITDGPILAHFVAIDGSEARSNPNDNVPRITIDGKRPVITNDGVSPNPFNPYDQFTYIRYILTENASISINIFNERNQLVRQLGTPSGKPGENYTTWNGADDLGNIVPDGLYTYQISGKDKAGNEAIPTRGGVILSTVYVEIDNSLIAPNPFSPEGDNVNDIALISFDIKLKADERQLRVLGFGYENYVTASTEDDDKVFPFGLIGISIFDSSGKSQKVFSHDLTPEGDTDFAPNGWTNGEMPPDVPLGSGNFLGMPNWLPDFADENKTNDWDTLIPLHGPFKDKDEIYYLANFAVGWDAKDTPDGTYLVNIECELVGRSWEFVDYMKGQGDMIIGEKWHAVPVRRYGVKAFPRTKSVIIARRGIVAVDNKPPIVTSTEPASGALIDPTQQPVKEILVMLDDGAGGSGVDPIETKVVLLDPLGNPVGSQHLPYGINMVKLVLDEEIAISGEYTIQIIPVDKRGNKASEPIMVKFNLQDTSAPTVVPNTVLPKPNINDSDKPYTEPIIEASVVLTDGLTGSGVNLKNSNLYIRDSANQTLEGILSVDADNNRLRYILKNPIATSGTYTIVIIAIDNAGSKAIYTYQFIMDMAENITIQYNNKTYLLIYANTEILSDKTPIQPSKITVTEVKDYPSMAPEIKNATGTAIKFDPHGIQLTRRAELTLYYEDSQIPIGIDKNQLAIYSYKAQIKEWSPLLNSVVSADDNRIKASVDYLDQYYIIAYTSPIAPTPENEVSLSPEKFFNPEKEILNFVFARNITDYQITIYNAAGDRITSLDESKLDYSLGWNGRNDDDRIVNNGIYICRITYAIGNKSKTLNKLIAVVR